jgi:glucose 1-dehydrogenase
MDTLEGKVVVVTGSTRGLGLAIARACVAQGATVVLSSRSSEAVATAVTSMQANGVRASGIVCDVSDLAQVEALSAHAIETFGGFDVWVNNAGYAGYYGPTAHVATSAFVRTLQTNILGTYYGSMTALRHFLPQSKGKLINLLGYGDRRPAPMQNAYGSSKAWVRNFTLAMAEEYRDSGVGIFAYGPGMMATDMLTDVQVVSGYEARLKALPAVLRTLSTPPEVAAGKVAWLASAATDGRTGLEIHQLSGMAVPLRFLRSGLRRLMGRQEPLIEVQISLVPADLPVPDVRR